MTEPNHKNKPLTQLQAKRRLDRMRAEEAINSAFAPGIMSEEALMESQRGKAVRVKRFPRLDEMDGDRQV